MNDTPRTSAPTFRRMGESTDPELAEAARLLHQPLDEAGVQRRHFLQGMLAVGGVTALGMPLLSSRHAEAGPPLGANERILIALVLDGGNDGLNTVCPLDEGRYFDLRPNLAVNPAGTHPVGDNLYLHPNLSRLKDRFDSGQVAIIRGVGEPSDDHSHFQSMARWMAGTAAPAPWYSGFLGRYIDGIGGDELASVTIGHHGVPLHMRRANGPASAIPGWGGLFGLDYDENNYNRPMYQALLDINAGSLSADRLQDIAATNSRSVATADQVGAIFNPEITIQNEIIRDAELVARLVNLDIGARVISLSMGGYDHHADQRPSHDDFMDSIDRAINRILTSIEPRFRSRVCIMTMSEFGRRPEQNGSGTDHGTANAMFVIGDGVSGGLYGAQPSLRRLDQRGDLRHEVDFRSMYATLLEGWLGADSNEILGASYETLPLFTTTCGGEEATIIGTGAGETIHGTSGRDVIFAGGGADIIHGNGGDDLICGGAGNDTVFAGDGNDNVWGGSGSDDLRGGRGNDYLRGDAGHDQIHGDMGADTLRGGEGADQLFGKRTEDTFISGLADTILRGQ